MDRIMHISYVTVGIGGTSLVPVFVGFLTWPTRPTTTQIVLGFSLWLIVLVPVTAFYLRWAIQPRDGSVADCARIDLLKKEGNTKSEE